MRVPFRIAQLADNMAKTSALPFRDCLDLVMRAYLRGEDLIEVEETVLTRS